MSSSRLTRPIIAGITAALTTTIAGAAVAGAHSTSTSDQSAGGVGYHAFAYGSSVRGLTADSGRSALAPIGCTSHAGADVTNHTAASDLGALGKVGAVTTSSSTDPASDEADQSSSESRTSGVKLLGKAITAGEIDTTAAVNDAGSGLQSAGTTTINALQVNGKEYHVQGKNQKIPVPGIGHLVVNQQRVTQTGGTQELAVNAMHLVVTKDLKNIAKGTSLVVGHSTAALTEAPDGLLRGQAYGTEVDVANRVVSSPTFKQPLNCVGTDGKTARSSGHGTGVKGVTEGAVVDTAEGTISPDAAARTSSRVQGVNLLGGKVRADVVKAVASARGASDPTLQADGSRIAGLVIDGHKYNGTIKPNTQMKVPGVGELTLEEVANTATTETVHMMDLKLTKRWGQLAKGTHVLVGNAIAGTHG